MTFLLVQYLSLIYTASILHNALVKGLMMPYSA